MPQLLPSCSRQCVERCLLILFQTPVLWPFEMLWTHEAQPLATVMTHTVLEYIPHRITFNFLSKLTVVTCSDIDIGRRSISFDGRRRHSYRVEGALKKTGQCRLSCWCIHNHCLWKTTTIVQSAGNCVIQYDTILICSWNLVPLNKNSGGACVVPTDISRRTTWSCKDSGRKV